MKVFSRFCTRLAHNAVENFARIALFAISNSLNFVSMHISSWSRAQQISNGFQMWLVKKEFKLFSLS